MSRFRETKMISFRLGLEENEKLNEISKQKTKGNRTWALEHIIETYFNEWLKGEDLKKITNKKSNDKK